MPRPLVFGNGSFLVQLDSRHRIRDLCFPYVGQTNHLAGHAIRMGVWREGRFSWCDSDDWSITQTYEEGSLVGRTRLHNESLGIELDLSEVVDADTALFVREIQVKNHGSSAEVRLFFSHDIRLEESDIGDTALFHPAGAVVHYKRHSALLFTGRWGDTGIYQYQCCARHGTWPESDAEDGELHMNPIEQGSVASVISLRGFIAAGETSHASYRIAASTGLDEALQGMVAHGNVTPVKLNLSQVTPTWQGLHDRSLLTIQTQIDSSNGAITAANDSDILRTARATYSYLWMRDGALVSAALDHAGLTGSTKAFFELCHQLLPSDPPVFAHKYCPDGSLGASWHPYVWEGSPIVPFQEDSSALVVWALSQHLECGGNVHQVRSWYEGMACRICQFMAEYVDEHGLPKPSWDLWEERRGVHAYTAATVIAGLRVGASLASRFGDQTRADTWRAAADRMASAVREHLWNEDRGNFYRMIGDDTVDSATLAFGLFGVFPPDDPMVARNADTIERTLSVRGGIARYENDYYFRQREGYLGNPWVITTMWLAQMRILQGDLAAAEIALQWVCDHQEPTGILAEQYHPDSGVPLSVSPLTWSHAEVVRTIQMLSQASLKL